MTATSEIITALVAAIIPIGGGFAFVWNKLERRFREIEVKLDECHAREIESQARRADQLTLIELLLQELRRHAPEAYVLKRAQRLLDDLRQRGEKEE